MNIYASVYISHSALYVMAFTVVLVVDFPDFIYSNLFKE